MTNEAEKGGGPAFPTLEWWPWHGMTLRDWFAGQMLSALGCNERVMSAATAVDFNIPSFRASLAAEAYAQADAMLAERSKAEAAS